MTLLSRSYGQRQGLARGRGLGAEASRFKLSGFRVQGFIVEGLRGLEIRGLGFKLEFGVVKVFVGSRYLGFVQVFTSVFFRLLTNP